jgi:hypothetical protein
MPDSVTERLRRACADSEKVLRNARKVLSKDDVDRFVKALSADRLKKYRETFEGIDEDGSGGLDEDELCTCDVTCCALCECAYVCAAAVCPPSSHRCRP